MCDTRIEDLLTQISGRMGDEVGEDDRSTWTEIREEQKNKARLVGVAQRVEFAEGRAVTMDALMAMQSEILNLMRNTVFGWEGKVVRPHVFLQEFQTAFIRRFGLDPAKVVDAEVVE